MDNTSSIQGPPMFQMPNMGQAAGNAFSQIGGLGQFGNLGSSVLPQAQQTSQNLYNNPFASQGLQGAQQGAGMGGQAAMTGFNTGAGMVGEGQGLMGAGNSLIPYASQIMQSGFDPQQQLYNRTLQQVQDQTRAGEASRGIATTPYGAGLENQATENFNIDWQNQQLGRQATAAGAAGGLVGQGANVAGQGAGIQGQGVNMMNQAPGQMVQSAMLPYATYSDIGQGQNNALTSLLGIGSQGQGLANLPIQDLLSYLGVGNQAGGVANQNFNNQLGQANQAWNQQGQFAQGIGSAASTFLPMLLGL
jgi:hypothetical protein